MKKILFVLLIGCAMAVSCSEEEEPFKVDNPNLSNEQEANFELQLNFMKYLGRDFIYEGWLLLDDPDSPISIGAFSVGLLTSNPQTIFFSLDETTLSRATGLEISIEPINDTDPTQSPSVILRGDFNNGSAQLDISSIADFDPVTITGSFFLRTPTDESGPNNGNDQFGVWFGQPGEPPSPSLVLPELDRSNGWLYEGWVQVGLNLVSTGKFTSFDSSDDNAGTPLSFGGSQSNGPDLPGEDFLQATEAAPSGISFPIDVRGRTVFISIEPYPDNDPAELFTGCLIGVAPMQAVGNANILQEDLQFSPFGRAIIR